MRPGREGWNDRNSFSTRVSALTVWTMYTTPPLHQSVYRDLDCSSAPSKPLHPLLPHLIECSSRPHSEPTFAVQEYPADDGSGRQPPLHRKGVARQGRQHQPPEHGETCPPISIHVALDAPTGPRQPASPSLASHPSARPPYVRLSALSHHQFGATPLINACARDYRPMTKLLLAAGADLTIKHKVRCTLSPNPTEPDSNLSPNRGPRPPAL